MRFSYSTYPTFQRPPENPADGKLTTQQPCGREGQRRYCTWCMRLILCWVSQDAATSTTLGRSLSGIQLLLRCTPSRYEGTRWNRASDFKLSSSFHLTPSESPVLSLIPFGSRATKQNDVAQNIPSHSLSHSFPVSVRVLANIAFVDASSLVESSGQMAPS
jgi:hypothetical protein